MAIGQAWVAAALAALALLGACRSEPVAPEPQAIAAQAGPVLWRVADADSTIWLFGTVHMLPQDLAWQSDPVMRAFDAAETVYFEAKIDEAEVGTLTRSLGVNPAGVTLSGHLSAEGRARLARVAQSLGVPVAGLEAARPWLVGLQLSLAHAQSRGHQPNLGVEAVLAARLAVSGRTPRYLETAESQVRALADLPVADQVAFLESGLKEIEADPFMPDRLAQAWARGEVAPLAAMIDQARVDPNPAAYEALFTRRNAAWAGQIASLLEGEGEVFIAAGAAHFVGPDSVVAMLRARGVAVEGP